nr:PREDICTED: splicing factor 3B subunit 3-like [Bemisia tabaci]
MRDAAGEEEEELAREMAEAFLTEDLPENIFGAPKAGSGMWASLVRILDPVEGKTEQVIRFAQNEAVVSIALCKFSVSGDQQYVVLGVAKDLQLNPRQCDSGFLYTYRLVLVLFSALLSSHLKQMSD